MFDRLKLLAGVILVAAVVVLLSSFEVTALLAGWCLCIYVCWRAVPGIRVDVDRFRSRYFPTNSWRL